MTETTLPRILLAHRVHGALLSTTNKSIQSHKAIKESAKRGNLKLICDSVYDFVPDVFSIDEAITCANGAVFPKSQEKYSHIIVDAQDANDQKLFPDILRKFDSGFIVLNPFMAPLEYLRKTGADFAVTNNHLRGDGTSIPFEDQLATALDLITKRITNGYFINDKLLCARKNTFMPHKYTKSYELAQGRSFSWLKY